MRHSLKYIPVLVYFILLKGFVYSQGCSDAGFCTIPTIKTASQEDSAFRLKNHLKLGTTYGIAQYGVSIMAPYVEYIGELGNRLSTAVKVIYAVHAGDLASTHGLADIIASMDYRISGNAKVVLGIKVPFNRADKKKDGLSLPMAYQTSLGTADVVLGLAMAGRYFSLTAAIQQPFMQNKNEFLREAYPDGVLTDDYLSTQGYHRNGDILLRLSYPLISGSKRIALIPSILPIYHLGNDSYIDNTGQRAEILGSGGLTLNLNLFLRYRISESNHIEMAVGAPVIARTARPDGLSQFSLGVEYVIAL